MLISVKPVLRPRKVHFCADCHFPIHGAHIVMYGAAHRGEKPYRIRVHSDCGGHFDNKREQEKLEAARILLTEDANP